MSNRSTKIGSQGFKPYDESWEDKILNSMPGEFDIIDDTSAHTGKWDAIQIWEIHASMFGDNTTDVKIRDTGKNLSGLNSGLAHGDMIYGTFTSITLGGGIVIAYKLR